MKKLTAKEAHEEARMRNEIAVMKEEIYEGIFKAATKGEYKLVYEAKIELNEALFVLMLMEFGDKGYKIAWFSNQNKLLLIW